MVNFWKIVNDVIDKSDILLEVLDSRLPDMTRNAEVEGKVKRAGKKLVLVLNKADLIGQRTAEKEKRKFTKEYPVVFVSTREHQGTKLLREAILKNVEKDAKDRRCCYACGFNVFWSEKTNTGAYRIYSC